jgi:hypothetical protein
MLTRIFEPLNRKVDLGIFPMLLKIEQKIVKLSELFNTFSIPTLYSDST